MGVIIPQLSNKERDDRLSALRKNPIFPVSTQWSLTVNNVNYPTADGSTLGQYTSNPIQLPAAYGIVGVRLTNTLKTITDGIIVAVSYLSSFTVAPTAGIATQPDDASNVIYRAACVTAGFNETIWYKNGPDPDNLFVEANRPIYIFQWASTAAIAAGSMTAQGFLTLYLQQTGVRT